MQNGNIENIINKIEGLRFERDKINRDIDRARDELIQIMGSKEEGTISAMTMNYRVSLRFSMAREIDMVKFEQVRDYVPPQILERLIRFEPKIVMHELRWLQENKPGIYGAVCDFITTKPAKPSLTYSRVEEKENGN
jgi:hypothetical protein